MGWKKWKKKLGKYTGMSAVGLGDPLGTKAQKRANRANEARYQQALGIFDDTEPGIGQAFGQQRQSIGQAQDITRQGFGQAIGSLNTMGQRSRQRATDIGLATTGQQSAGLQNRGLGTSTRLAGLARGVAADTQRGIQSVNEGVAGATSGLQAQQADRLANLQNLMGASYVNQNSALNQWRLSKINTIASRQDVAGPGWLGQAAAIGGNVAKIAGLF